MKSRVEYNLESILKQGCKLILFQSNDKEFTCIIKEHENAQRFISDSASSALNKAGEDQTKNSNTVNYYADFADIDSNIISVLLKNEYYIKFFCDERNADNIICVQEPLFGKCDYSFIQPFVKTSIVDCIKYINQTLSGFPLELLRKLSWEDSVKAKARLNSLSDDVEVDISMGMIEALGGEFLRDVKSDDGASKK
jgi:hypothetical protein